MEINEMEQRLALLEDSRKPLLQSFGQLLNEPNIESVLLPDTLTTQTATQQDSMANKCWLNILF
ncbi:MAG: hypothetical protein R3B93_06290 [Bacteroidia bacterium]